MFKTKSRSIFTVNLKTIRFTPFCFLPVWDYPKGAPIYHIMLGNLWVPPNIFCFGLT